MKRKSLLVILTLCTSAAFAESGTTGISEAADGVVTYMPYVRALCYVIAALIGVVGATYVYYTMQTNPQNTTKRISLTVGSALTFICLSLALPQFFGIDGTVASGCTGGSNTSGETTSGDGFLSTDEGGISKSGFDTSIPPIQDKNGNWITFPEGTNMSIVNSLMDIYDHMGSGSSGSYGRTLDYITELYRSGNLEESTYHQMMTAAGSLPHN